MGCDPALEAAFSASWDDVIVFYTEWASGQFGRRGGNPDARWARPLLELIGELRDAGYDRTLRAGQSLTSLVVSRSREHGMRPEQPSIVLSPRDDQVIARPSWLSAGKLAIGYTCDPRLIALLDELVARPIT